jgi:signal transduction histidine kinase
MEKSNEELSAELKQLQLKCKDLEEKYQQEIDVLKKEKEELCFKMMFLEGIANSAIDGFLVVNPYGKKIFQNNRVSELWKISQEIVDDPDGMKQVNHVMHMTVNPQKFYDEIEFQKEHPFDKMQDELELIDGTVLDRYSSPVIGADGINYGRIYTFHDITERKNIENYLLQVNADKDRFISILAHDLRSPFNSLLGASEFLLKKIKDYPIDKIEKMIEAIYISAKKTYELLEDTLLWSSLKSQLITFTPSNINLKEIITEVTDIMQPSAKFKNITIENSEIKDIDVYADVYMLKAILRNLISNALKFTRNGGKIDIGVIKNTSETVIKVFDNGVGIKEEMLGKLFSFSSIKPSKGTSNEVGTGFGLILCKEFVDKHNGKIWIESIVDKGTVVSFSLPDKDIV